MTASTTTPAPRAPPARTDDDPFSAERALLDHARAALALDNLPGAITALAAHARRFPGGQNAVVREQMWAEACARHRLAPPQRDVPEMASRCTGR